MENTAPSTQDPPSNDLSHGNQRQNYGAYLWPCAVALTDYLTFAYHSTPSGNRNPHNPRGKRILELGAGLGQPSLHCIAKLEAESAILTDALASFKSSFEPNLLQFIAQDPVLADQKSRIHILPLDLVDPLNVRNGLDSIIFVHSSVDLILASDIFYDNNIDHSRIVRTIALCMKELSCPTCLLVYQERSSKLTIQPYLKLCGVQAKQILNLVSPGIWIWELNLAT